MKVCIIGALGMPLISVCRVDAAGVDDPNGKTAATRPAKEEEENQRPTQMSDEQE